MDIWSSLYSLAGVSEPLYIALEALVSIILAAGLAGVVLETGRIYQEYRAPVKKSTQAPVKPVKKILSGAPPKMQEKVPEKVPPKAPAKAPAKPVIAVPEAPKVDITKLPERTVIPRIDVIKGTLKESVVTMKDKYKLDSVTLSSPDGLVIASTSNTPDEDAAIFSGLFMDMYKAKPSNYYSVPNKYVHMYLIESRGSRLIGIVKRPGALVQEEVSGLQDDSRSILEKFASGGKK